MSRNCFVQSCIAIPAHYFLYIVKLGYNSVRCY